MGLGDESGPYPALREPIRPSPKRCAQALPQRLELPSGKHSSSIAEGNRRHDAICYRKKSLPSWFGSMKRSLADMQLERLKRKLKESDESDSSVILEAHQLILRDEHLLGPTRRHPRRKAQCRVGAAQDRRRNPAAL